MKNSKHSSGQLRILDILYYRTAICLAVAAVISTVAAVLLGLLFFQGKDLIVSGWSPLRGERVESLKALILVMCVAGIFAVVFSWTYGLTDKYIRARAERKDSGAHNQAL